MVRTLDTGGQQMMSGADSVHRILGVARPRARSLAACPVGALWRCLLSIDRGSLDLRPCIRLLVPRLKLITDWGMGGVRAHVYGGTESGAIVASTAKMHGGTRSWLHQARIEERRGSLQCHNNDNQPRAWPGP